MFGRRSKPEAEPKRQPAAVSDEVSGLALGIAMGLKDAVDAYEDLLAQLDGPGVVDREAVMLVAQRSALITRSSAVMSEWLVNELPDELDPRPAIRALRQIQWALVLGAREPLDRRSLLPRDEVVAVLEREGAGVWMHTVLIETGNAAEVSE